VENKRQRLVMSVIVNFVLQDADGEDHDLVTRDTALELDLGLDNEAVGSELEAALNQEHLFTGVASSLVRKAAYEVAGHVTGPVTALQDVSGPALAAVEPPADLPGPVN